MKATVLEPRFSPKPTSRARALGEVFNDNGDDEEDPITPSPSPLPEGSSQLLSDLRSTSH